MENRLIKEEDIFDSYKEFKKGLKSFSKHTRSHYMTYKSVRNKDSSRSNHEHPYKLKVLVCEHHTEKKSKCTASIRLILKGAGTHINKYMITRMDCTHNHEPDADYESSSSEISESESETEPCMAHSYSTNESKTKSSTVDIELETINVYTKDWPDNDFDLDSLEVNKLFFKMLPDSNYSVSASTTEAQNQLYHGLRCLVNSIIMNIALRVLISVVFSLSRFQFFKDLQILHTLLM